MTLSDPSAAPISAPTTFAQLTTLRVGGPVTELVVADDEATLLSALDPADDDSPPALVVAGGSNLVVGDSGYPGRVVLVRTSGIQVEADSCGGAWLTVAAGESWDQVVALAVGSGWLGIEALSGIPGSVGATPIQNVGAYGQQVSDVIARVRTWDREAQVQRTFTADECGFGYRTSRFKAEPDRYAILEVTFQLRPSSISDPISYAELTGQLAVGPLSRVPIADVRAAVLELRGRKGMVLDQADHDTWSAGSFFTTPLLDSLAAQGVPADAPRYPADDDKTKTSAAWLIEHAGFARGYGTGLAQLSSKHSLAITNRGGATTSEIVALAREIRDGVQMRFGITLDPEPMLVNCSL